MPRCSSEGSRNFGGMTATDSIVDAIAPHGIDGEYRRLDVMHRRELSGTPGFALVNTKAFDIDGQPVSSAPQLTYYSQ